MFTNASCIYFIINTVKTTILWNIFTIKMNNYFNKKMWYSIKKILLLIVKKVVLLYIFVETDTFCLGFFDEYKIQKNSIY